MEDNSEDLKIIFSGTPPEFNLLTESGNDLTTESGNDLIIE